MIAVRVTQEQRSVIDKLGVKQYVQKAALTRHHQLRHASNRFWNQLAVADYPKSACPLGYQQ